MNNEILINVNPQEIRVAQVSNASLQEVCIERKSRRGLVGNIYKGKVVRVLPGMEAVFVDINLEKAGFLHVTDIAESQIRTDDGAIQQVPIQQILREGQDVLVQVTKDPMGTKGARLSTHLSVASRYLVLMPNDSTLGVSSKIENEAERNRLKKLLTGEIAQDKGCIIRTAAEGVEESSLCNDFGFLCKVWHGIEEQYRTAKCGTIVYQDLPLALKTLRDINTNDVKRVLVDSRITVQKMKAFAAEYIPTLVDKIEHYSGEGPIFDIYGIEDELKNSLGKKVLLKSGGYLIIDQTEAMTTIDVNTGGYVGHKNLEETIYRTNLEASQALARQLRLRNLGGIIIVDFIDMLRNEHKKQVINALEKELEKDHAKTHVCDVSPLGLVEMTRKRTRESLEHILCEACPTCHGIGTVKTPQTVCYDTFREILRQTRQFEVSKLLVIASQDVIDMLLDEEAQSLAGLEEFIDVPIRLQVESTYSQQQFDVVLV